MRGARCIVWVVVCVFMSACLSQRRSSLREPLGGSGPRDVGSEQVPLRPPRVLRLVAADAPLPVVGARLDRGMDFLELVLCPVPEGTTAAVKKGCLTKHSVEGIIALHDVKPGVYEVTARNCRRSRDAAARVTCSDESRFQTPLHPKISTALRTRLAAEEKIRADMRTVTLDLHKAYARYLEERGGVERGHALDELAFNSLVMGPDLMAYLLTDAAYTSEILPTSFAGLGTKPVFADRDGPDWVEDLHKDGTSILIVLGSLPIISGAVLYIGGRAIEANVSLLEDAEDHANELIGHYADRYLAREDKIYVAERWKRWRDESLVTLEFLRNEGVEVEYEVLTRDIEALLAQVGELPEGAALLKIPNVHSQRGSIDQRVRDALRGRHSQLAKQFEGRLDRQQGLVMDYVRYAAVIAEINDLKASTANTDLSARIRGYIRYRNRKVGLAVEADPVAELRALEGRGGSVDPELRRWVNEYQELPESRRFRRGAGPRGDWLEAALRREVTRLRAEVPEVDVDVNVERPFPELDRVVRASFEGVTNDLRALGEELTEVGANIDRNSARVAMLDDLSVDPERSVGELTRQVNITMNEKVSTLRFEIMQRLTDNIFDTLDQRTEFLVQELRASVRSTKQMRFIDSSAKVLGGVSLVESIEQIRERLDVQKALVLGETRVGISQLTEGVRGSGERVSRVLALKVSRDLQDAAREHVGELRAFSEKAAIGYARRMRRVGSFAIVAGAGIVLAGLAAKATDDRLGLVEGRPPTPAAKLRRAMEEAEQKLRQGRDAFFKLGL